MSNGSNDKDSIGEGYTCHFSLIVEEDLVFELKKLTKERRCSYRFEKEWD